MGNAFAKHEEPLKTLEFKFKEELPENTVIYQVNGTVFYHRGYPDSTRLYVRYGGTTVEADFGIESGSESESESGSGDGCGSDVRMTEFVVHGNSLYFAEPEAICSATFEPPDEIVISRVRDRIEGEWRFKNGIFMNADKLYVYRMHDDPVSDRVVCAERLLPALIHNGRAIFLDFQRSIAGERPSLLKYDERSIYLRISSNPLHDRYGAWDSSPFVYLISHTGYLYTESYNTALLRKWQLPDNGHWVIDIFDTRIMKFLPRLKIEGVKNIYSIRSETNGLLTVICWKDRYCWATAQLPQGYFIPLDAPVLKNFKSEFLTRFTPQSLLGQGGFGSVFRAQNIMDECIYAVKRIPLKRSETALDSALKEVRTLAWIKHPGIVGYKNSWIERPPIGWQEEADDELMKKLESRGTCDYEDNSAFLYIQMELCKKSLHQWLHENSSRDLHRAKSWFKQIVEAVAYLHQKLKIHRDLKPSNILFSEDGKLKICDLGLVAEYALRNGKEVDRTRSAIGTPMYMAPEQYWGYYTSAVDIFSLGLIFIELCVCMTGDQKVEVFNSRRAGRPISVLDNLPEVNEFVCWLANKDSDKRPTCDEILRSRFLS